MERQKLFIMKNIEQLISKGRDKHSLTFGEINEYLNENFFSRGYG
jgi:hypothetical protein